jgi:hypothetical protein
MSFSNIALYIKRAEMHHTEEYITNAFRDQRYGELAEIKFIKKTNFETGKDYNGAIVSFKYWFNSANVKQLFEQMNSTADGSAKIMHGYNRFWIVCQHKSFEEKVNTLINNGLPDKARIEELEKLVASMSAQMNFMQTQQEKIEQKFMDYEQKEIHSALVNAELRSRLQENELGDTKMAQDIYILKGQVALLEYKLEEKIIECDQLKEELYEESNILAYVHAQANEMRDMLHIDIKPLKEKMTIEELLD